MNTKRILFLLPALIFTTVLFAQVNLTQGLKMYLPFTGNATDASGNGNVATVNGAPLLPTDLATLMPPTALMVLTTTYRW
jgi:hypothetical protein